MYSCVGGAIGALSGENLAAGANVQVMKMLHEIGDNKNVEKWVKGSRLIREGG